MFQKKSLGQNFLSNPKILDKIISAAGIARGETVLEAGPGQGTLTEKLLAAGASVTAVEKDRRLIPLLRQKFSAEIASGRLFLVEGDILHFDALRYAPRASRYKIVANIPYYVTGAFIKKFLEAEKPPSAMVILVQKEVAERIVAKDGSPLHLCHCHKHRQLSEIERQNLKQLYEKGLEQRCGGKESLLSISVKVYGAPRYTETVKAGSFRPSPSVDSAIISIENISKKNFAGFSEEKFFKLLRAGFAHKRKRLAGNLKKLWPNAQKALENLGADPDIRPEDVSLALWLSLAEIL